ncbi:MAG: RNA 2',3'-cyclic phosphodiesterase [Candidatus Caldatribacterium sp.]|uniref:RNA 2',3'-cyclic phosphodiesterase n=1 Tax=Candidatus Caldatribacterium sp. TaxID=2282143 RepID=UPI002998C6FA|nr:RNA 2',3'-cyclic phosphodiesterase [Candidatus Caldatribacterium sp.]MCX7731115.1 RNA 2',3'-cyclic phosphodiesterase [Candidatus Caldatribacterium sp.]MDW8081452.1 RNA 2',3'-cyclic phosphodiesterase [Candidatus Calescibacterium sp.]
MSETLRAFIALDLPEDAKNILAHFVEKQKFLYPEGKWVRREHFHITLAFFPAFPFHRLREVQNILEDLGAAFSPYHTFLEEAGTFPSWQRARVLWMGLDEEGKRKTKAIVEAMSQKLRAAGIAYEEDREFVPHVTLARFKAPKKLERTSFLSWSPIPVTIGEIALFESILRPSGPEYRKLVCVPLKGVRA